MYPNSKNVFLGQTERSINTRKKEGKANCRLEHAEKSAITAHASNQQNHEIRFAEVLAQVAIYHIRLYPEAISTTIKKSLT